jgi:hypothetical protein
MRGAVQAHAGCGALCKRMLERAYNFSKRHKVPILVSDARTVLY